MINLNFCSVLNKKSGEPLAGSAPFAKYFVFISWPKKFWQFEALEAKGGFPKGLKTWMKENSKVFGKISIRLANRRGLNNEEVEIFIYPSKYHYTKIKPNKILEVLDSHFQQETTNQNFVKQIKNDQIFICTHGRHDKCCAKFGQKLADKMRLHVFKKKLPVEIWESSHIGGHRFAATLIDFPSGYSYGRLTPEEIPNFFEYRKKGKLYASAYRGSVFLTELEKVAEAHVQHYCSEQNFSSKLTIQNIQKISEKKFTCDVLINPSNGLIDPKVASQKELSFSFFLKNFKTPSGCDSLEESELRKCWKMESPISE